MYCCFGPARNHNVGLRRLRDERHGTTRLYAFARCVNINQSIMRCTCSLCIKAYALSLDLEHMHGINAPAMPNCCY